MLIGVPPLLGPDILSALRAMGHGDELAIVDGNYPATEHGRRVLRADGHGVIEVIDAVLSVLPVDDFVPHALFCASVGGDPDKLDPIHHEMIDVCARKAPGISVLPWPVMHSTGVSRRPMRSSPQVNRASTATSLSARA